MSEKNFIEKLKDIMDTEENLKLDTKLAELEDWDSLSVVAFLSFCNANLKKQISPDEVKNAKTVGELFAMAGGV